MTSDRQRLLRLAGALLIIVMTAAAYAPALTCGFIWDDDNYLLQNPHLDDVDGLVRLWIPGFTKQYYPLVFTTFWIEKQLWGLAPAGYHAVNIALHILTALLVWRVFVRLGLSGAVAWMIGAVFALHPMHVESVAWITERKNVLSAFFYLTAALCYLRFENTHPPTEPGALGTGSATRDWCLYAAAIALFICALLSKTVTCSLPAALILVHLHLRQRLTWRRLTLLAPMFVIGLVLALHTAHLEKESVGAVGPEFDFSIGQRVLIAANALLFYPMKLLWPHPLIFIYPRWPIDDPPTWMYAAPLIVIAIASGALWMYFGGRRGSALALAFYAGTIFPALGFLDVWPMRYSFVADHFAYLGSLGIIALIIGAAASLIRRRHNRVVLAAAVLLALGVLTPLTIGKYRDSRSLWAGTIRQNPAAWIAHNNLGLILRAAGDLDGATAGFQEALRFNPQHDDAMRNLAETCRLQGDNQASLQWLLKARDTFIAAHGRTFPPDLERLGVTLELLGRTEEAIESYRQAIALNPDLIQSHFRLGVLLAKAGRDDDAVEHFRAVLEKDPNNITAAGFLGDWSRSHGRYEDVADLYRRALAGPLTDEDRVVVEFRLAWFEATCPDPRFRDGESALEVAEPMARVAPSPASLDLLGAALAAAGRFEEAIAAAARASELARAQGRNDVAEKIDRRADFYRSGRAWTE